MRLIVRKDLFYLKSNQEFSHNNNHLSLEKSAIFPAKTPRILLIDYLQLQNKYQYSELGFDLESELIIGRSLQINVPLSYSIASSIGLYFIMIALIYDKSDRKSEK